MTIPINVDEARKALARVERASYSRAPPYFQSPDFATISAALDRLEELEANLQGVHIPEAREALNRLIRNKGVSLEEASFLSTAINRAEEVPALSMERDAAQAQCAEAERAANKAELQCVDLKAQLETVNGAAKILADALNITKRGWENESAKLETAKGLLRRYRKGLSREPITAIDVDCDAFLSSKEGEEPSKGKLRKFSESMGDRSILVDITGTSGGKEGEE